MSKAIPLKQWVHAEAAREHVTPHAIYERKLSGWYPALSLIEVNKRLIYVALDDTPKRIRFMQWVKQEARKEGVSPQAICNRIARGKYPKMSFSRINRSVVFVEL